MFRTNLDFSQVCMFQNIFDLFLRLGLLTVLRNMTVFNMIVVETEGGGGVADSRSEDWGEGEEEEEEGEGEGGFAATEKNRRKCRDMIGR